MQGFNCYRTGITMLATLLLCMNEVVIAATAASTYAQYCSVCHGEKGDGRSHAARGLRPPPRDFTTPEAAHLLTREYMAGIIANGKPGTAMAAWSSQLDSTRIAALADYIRSKFMHKEGADTMATDSVDTGAVHAGTAQADGKLIYDSTCSVCHGDDGAGAVWGHTSLNPPPANFTIADPENQLTRARMLASVTHGRPGTAMTAFGSQLTDAEITTVVDYIRSSFMGKQAAPAADAPASQAVAASTVGMAVMYGMPADTHAPMREPVASGPNATFPHGLAGDAKSGMALYMANCTACHGSTGQGDGPRAYFIFPKPRNFLLAESRARLNRPALFNAIRHGVPGREMPAWSKVMDDQQIAHIAEYVFRTFIAGVAQTGVN